MGVLLVIYVVLVVVLVGLSIGVMGEKWVVDN
jgi:hypothetical protein